MEDKVSLESLHTAKIKEINYEGEEAYQERPTLSQRLTELAQRIDFNEVLDGERSEPAAKRSTQKWPWEHTHSKLKQALTEVSVLSDVLQIAHSHKAYVAMDPVVAQPATSVPPPYQYLMKKKALDTAAGVLRKGTKYLSKSSTRGEREFHRALSQLRQRWKVRRAPSGSIVGDLSYNSAGSTYVSSVMFEVHKGEGLSGQGVKQEGEVVRVTIPRELRGKSEVFVFLAERPIREVDSLNWFPPPAVDELVKHHGSLPLWERKLVAAQNVLFNQELFTQLAREAYDQKTSLQFEVLSNRIIVPLSTKYWLSILHVREYNPEEARRKSSSDLPVPPPPRWELVIALKQLLRESHRRQTALNAPHPATSNFTDSPELKKAGVNAVSSTKLKQITRERGIFTEFVQKAKHCQNEEHLNQWLTELCSMSTDPLLTTSWVPSLSLTSTTANLHFIDPTTNSTCRTLVLSLSVDTLTVQQIEEKALVIPLDKDRLLGVLRHQVVIHRMLLACQIAEGQKWNVLQRFPRPLLSHTLAKSSGEYTEACNILLESADAHKKVDVLLEWIRVTISLTQYAKRVDDIAMAMPETRNFSLDSQFGHSFKQRFTNMLISVSN